jgi:hypothetical protein
MAASSLLPRLVSTLAAVAALGGCAASPSGATFQANVPVGANAPMIATYAPQAPAVKKAAEAVQLPPGMGLPLVVTFEGTPSPAMMRAVQDAAAVWNKGLGEEVIHVGPKASGQQVVVAVNEAIEPEGPSLVYGAARRSTPGDVWRIDFSKQTPAAMLPGTVLHELGHMLGLDHNASASSVMYQYATGQSRPSSDDLRQARQDVDALKLELATLLNRWRTQGR